MERILVGVDGPSSSTAAAVWAAGEAAMRDVELTVVHVVASPSDADTQTSDKSLTRQIPQQRCQTCA
jgi:nucleotide-binding universal stress UspA family protein